MLSTTDIDALAAALASLDPPGGVYRAIDQISAQRIGAIVFSASVTQVDAMEVERVYSSRPETYPVGVRTSKRQTSWGRQVLVERRVFVGEGALEMAAAFDDQEKMGKAGVRSIINVPVVLRGQCLGVLNFGTAADRVGPADVSVARLLALAASAVFLPA